MKTQMQTLVWEFGRPAISAESRPGLSNLRCLLRPFLYPAVMVETACSRPEGLH